MAMHELTCYDYEGMDTVVPEAKSGMMYLYQEDHCESFIHKITIFLCWNSHITHSSWMMLVTECWTYQEESSSLMMALICGYTALLAYVGTCIMFNPPIHTLFSLSGEFTSILTPNDAMCVLGLSIDVFYPALRVVLTS